jgi:probable HAF family extracellular repeat protein
MKSKILGCILGIGLFTSMVVPAGVIAQEEQHRTDQAQRYTVTDLGKVGPPPGQAFFVTNNGLIAGAAATPAGVLHAVVWFNKLKLDIGKPGLGGANSMAFGANVWGQAVGVAENNTPDPNGEDFCGFQAQGFPSSGSCLPFLWQFPSMTVLPTLGGPNGAVNQINNLGQVAGFAENTKPDPNCPAPQVLQFKPVVWKNGKPRVLPTYPGDRDGAALAINDNGQVAGASGDCAAFNFQLLLPLQPLHALLWQKGKMTDLGNLGGTGHGFGIIALNMNGKGQVVGNSDLPGDTTNHAFLWTERTGMRDLGTLSGDVLSAGLAVNDSAQVVGVSLDANFNLRAYLWENGQMTALDDLIPASSRLSLLLACSINSSGEIAGLAINKNTGELHAFLAKPKT